MTIITGLLSLVQGLLITKSLSNSNLKTSYLRMFISFYLNRLNEDDEKQTIKITDLPEIFKKIGHDERRILSFLNDLNEDVSEHGRLTILIKEAFNELRSERGDLFKILETVFDSSNYESLGYKLLGQDRDTLNLINQIIEFLKNNFGDLLELLNNVQDLVRININENND
ncbi:hypothetical protein KN1_00570 [Stygiolobus caldivivus]|uniref:Uncharacterized protein n=2 Tax=Stygiolobus caldivivus TaxID=2824673 RepID=A0A8D5ZHN9_9CREN|nr:hypothetical protein KN1_00570 [Stygiolobus caldivivus]